MSDVNRHPQLMATIGVVVGIVLIAIGLYLISVVTNGSVELVFFGQELSSTNIGFAVIFLGAVMIVLILMRVLRPIANEEDGSSIKTTEQRPIIDNKPNINISVNQTVESQGPKGRGDDAVRRAPLHTKILSALGTYDSDLPPFIDVWVGRKSELDMLKEMKHGVLAITGIGGQGKSMLAAKALESFRADYSGCFWDWRDCKEQANSFRTQLVSVIEHFTEGEITADSLSDADINWISKFLFKTVESRRGVIVFDNVDHYVDVDQCLFTSGISSFVNEALRVNHNFLIIFTCRPRISYPSVRFKELFLRGFTLDESIELFQLKLPGGIKDDQRHIVEEFHKLSNGHPLWLTIIASQVSRVPQKADSILEHLKAGDLDDRAKAMLRGIWHSLNDNQHIILKCMAELPRAVETRQIYDYLNGQIPTYNRFDKAFRGLNAICLITKKAVEETLDDNSRFELHPIVRAFVRAEYQSNVERSDFIASIILGCNQLVIRLKSGQADLFSDAVLEQLTTKAELEIAQGDIQASIVTLLDTSYALIDRGLHEEFIRLGKEILDRTDFKSSPWVDAEEFEKFFVELAKIMIEIGQSEEIRPFLDEFLTTTSHGTAKYIGLCNTYSYLEWFNENYDSAIEWGEKGVRVKKESGLDTTKDASHNLALAYRDSGQIDKALEFFCYGQDIDSILHDSYKKSKRSAPFYGNIGRCLALSGESQSALNLYVKSFDLLESEDADESTLLNKGYASLWIAEILEKLGDISNAYNFFRRATEIWKVRSPMRAEKALAGIERLKDHIPVGISKMSPSQVDENCKSWVDDYLGNLNEIEREGGGN